MHTKSASSADPLAPETNRPRQAMPPHAEVELEAGHFYFSSRFATDKFEAGTMSEYLNLFQGLRTRLVRLLEIGMGQGGSMRFFNSYFPHPESRFVGFDIHLPKATFDSRTKVFECNQNDSAALQALCRANGPFDIVIDDASHFAAETRNTYRNCIQHVVKGGYYIIEDWTAHYLGKQFEGMIQVIAELLDQAFLFDEIRIVRTYGGSTAVFRKAVQPPEIDLSRVGR